MSRARTAVHAAAATLAVVLAVALCASAVPLQSVAAKAAAKPPEARINVSDTVTAPSEPKIVRKVNPAYPADAKKEGVEGAYVLDVVIGKDGAVKDARVIGSAPTLEQLGLKDPAKRPSPAALAGDARLAAAALEAVRQWQYEPIVKDGKPVEFKATVTVVFKLA